MSGHAKLNSSSPSSGVYLSLSSALKASSGAFVSVGIFSFFINLLMLTGPLFMLQIYDRVLASRSIPTLLVLFMLVAGLYIVFGVLELIRSRILARIGAQVDARMSKRVFDGSMKTSLLSGGAPGSTTALRELGIVQQFLSGPALPALFDAPWVPVYIGIIFMFHPDLGVLALVAAIILFTLAVVNDVRSRKPAENAAKAASEAGKIVDTGRRNAEVLTAMSMLDPVRSRWLARHEEALSHEVVARDRTGTLSAVSKSMRLFLQSAMLAAGAALVIFGEVTPGVMIAASIILGRALQPVEQAIVYWRGLVHYRQATKNLKTFLQKMPPPVKKMPLPAPVGRLDVRGVQVGVPGQRKLVLRNASFSLKPGQIMGIVGLSAAGKSSLVRALVGVWKPVGGEIRLDGATYDQWSADMLGQYLGYLPQDVELFEGSVQENISRFQQQPDPVMVIEAAKKAGVHELIMDMGGYDTEVGHLGAHLSAGQRQRVALARALYGNPPLIVLDEPNSNLDEMGDLALAKALTELRKNGQTVVIVTHRMNILGLTDVLLELTQGVQTEFGPRDEVIQNIRQKRGHPGTPAPARLAGGNGANVRKNPNAPGTFSVDLDALPKTSPNSSPLTGQNTKPSVDK